VRSILGSDRKYDCSSHLFALVFPLTRLSFTSLSAWAQMVVHLLMGHNLSNDFLYSINPAYWSLAVEVQLYLLFPMSLIWVRRVSYGRVLLLLAAMEFTVRSIALFGFTIPHHTMPAWACVWPCSFWFSWSTGAAIADAHFNRRPLPFVRVHPLVWLGAGLMDSLLLTGQFGFAFFALFTASLIARSLRSTGSEGRAPWAQNFIRRIGIYSYSIYLIHQPIIWAISLLYAKWLPRFETHPFRVTLASASSWLVVFPLAALMYYSVERPSITLGKWVILQWLRRAADRSREQLKHRVTNPIV
jgi:peptidoglycan/LPS O-acetylase OafA/YrhL